MRALAALPWPAMRALVTLCMLLAAAPWASAAAPVDGPDLVFEVRLGSHLVSDATAAYQQGDDVYLPLGELARLLTIAIRFDPDEGKASGYILNPERGFLLDAASASVSVDGRQDRLAARDLLLRGDDIYVASRLLARWLPVALEIDMPNLTVRVTPREQLPLQARLERQARSSSVGGGAYVDPHYPHVATPYRMFDAPFIDQTLGLSLRPGASTAAYTAYASADLLGMEAALYVAHGSGLAPGSGAAGARLTLGRHDPGARLLGPLRARTALIGNVAAPGLPEVAQGNAGGNGFLVSNRPLEQPARLDHHSLRGDLAPGWDVELYYNDALVGFQQSGADGKYSFDELPLNYGPNEFRLVFHGPLGQLRIERHSFLLEQSLLAPGALVYAISSQRNRERGSSSVATLDWGISRQLTVSGALVHLGRHGGDQRFASIALNGYWKSFIAGATLIRADDGGRLTQLSARTRVMGMAVSATRAWSERFASDFYPATGNPVRVRDEVRIDGAVLASQLSVQARHERLADGQSLKEAALRLSTFRFGTAWSNAVRLQAGPAGRQVEGALQVSRRVAGIGLSGQALYGLVPDARLMALALSGDKRLGPGYLLNLGVTRTFIDPQLRYSAGLNKSVGRFGMGIGAFRTSRGEYGATVQLFTAIGREPRRALWAADSVPMAGSGAASVRVFLDHNRNGIMDDADEAISGAGFAMNGSSHMARTDADGIAYLGRLVPNQYLDIAVDQGTLEDPQWLAQQKGMRIVPRPGKVSELDFAIAITGEIDGTTYMLAKGVKRPIGDVELELVDASGHVAIRATSSADGYYILPGVVPGKYRLRVSPAQLARLGMAPAAQHVATHEVTMREDGAFVNGKDLVIARVRE